MPKNQFSSPRSGRCVDTVFHASALDQLQRLSPADLDRMIERWLKASGFSPPCRLSTRGSTFVYLTRLGLNSLRVPVLLQVYQRRNRLQVHHVDAFYGAVCREGAVAGILVTTGQFTREAVRSSTRFSGPVRCLSGTEWLSDLAVHRTGIGWRRLPCWVLDLHSHLAKDCSGMKGPHVRG